MCLVGSSHLHIAIEREREREREIVNTREKTIHMNM